MSTMRRFAAIPVIGAALTLCAFGVIRGVLQTGPARGIRLVLAIEPPVDDAARTMAVHVVRNRLDEKGLDVRVVPAGDQLVAEVGTEDAEIVKPLIASLERAATLEVHAVDAANRWLANVTTFAGTDPVATEAGVRVEGAPDARRLSAEDRRDELPVADADAIGCTGSVSAAGTRTCMRHGAQVLARYLEGLAARDPSLAVPSDRLIAYARVDGNRPSWVLHVLERDVLLDGPAIVRAEVVTGGVAIDVRTPETLARMRPLAPVAFLLDGRIRTISAPDRVVGRTLHVPIAGSDDAAIAAALELVAAIEAGAARPMHVRRHEMFQRTTGFWPRAWPFFAIAGVFSLAALVLLRRR